MLVLGLAFDGVGLALCA